MIPVFRNAELEPMLTYPEIDPVIFAIGPLKIRWYGLMYVLGFAAVHFLVGYQIRKYRIPSLAAHLENLNFTLIIYPGNPK